MNLVTNDAGKPAFSRTTPSFFVEINWKQNLSHKKYWKQKVIEIG